MISYLRDDDHFNTFDVGDIWVKDGKELTITKLHKGNKDYFVMSNGYSTCVKFLREECWRKKTESPYTSQEHDERLRGLQTKKSGKKKVKIVHKILHKHEVEEEFGVHTVRTMM